MGKYLWTQTKRMLRIMPQVLLVIFILFVCLLVVYSAMLQMNQQKDGTGKFRIAMVGTADDGFLQMGLMALEKLDSSRFAFEFLQVEEEQAVAMLDAGQIAAYVVIPDGFMEAALNGTVMPIKYVGTTGAAGITSVVKEEITYMITDIMVAAQKGIYGTWNAMVDSDQMQQLASVTDRISIAFLEFVFMRSRTYSVTELGISDNLGFQGYLLCGISVVFLMMATLPFAPYLIEQDGGMQALLLSRGVSVFKQEISRFLAYFLVLLGVLAAVILALSLGTSALGVSILEVASDSVLRVLPVILLVAAWSYFLYSVSWNYVTGILLHFFLTIVMCFVGGCMYPGYFFPDAIRTVGEILPAGLARIQVASCLTGEGNAAIPLLCYSGGFVLLSVLRSHIRSNRVRG